MKKSYIIYSAVAVVVVAAVAVFLLSGSSSNAYSGNQPVAAEQVAQLELIANNYTLANFVGIGTTLQPNGKDYPTPIVAPNLTVNGRPEVLYIGAEYCPYCAVSRWGLILALMRFGTFSNLTYMSSTQNDKFPNTPTFSFVNSTYSSNLVSFSAVETQNRDGQALQNPSAFEGSIFSAYDEGGSIPFIDFANSSVQIGAVVSPQVLAGMSQQQVIDALLNGNASVSEAIIGSANVFTAYLCKSDVSLSNATACKQGYVTAVLNQH